VDFKGEYATIKFDENVISAQEAARAMSVTPHMMGRGMQYGGTLLLGVAGFKDEATGKKAKAALSKVEGVEKVKLYPQQEAVGIEFTGKGKATTKQLIEALEAAGLKGAQYSAASESRGQARNGGDNSTPNHTGMAMDNGAMAGAGGMEHGMACGCAPYMQHRSRATIRGGCGCCR
jgi:copper chaperone CopZ